MVGGRLIEVAHLAGANPAIYRLWCVDGNDECAIRVQVGRDEALPEIGQEIWWQSGKVYFNNDKSWLPKIGNSYDPRPNQP
jgi:hypothetical protein